MKRTMVLITAVVALLVTGLLGLYMWREMFSEEDDTLKDIRGG